MPVALASCCAVHKLHAACSREGGGAGRAADVGPEAVQGALEDVALVLRRVAPDSQAALLEAVASLADRSPSKVVHAHVWGLCFRRCTSCHRGSTAACLL